MVEPLIEWRDSKDSSHSGSAYLSCACWQALLLPAGGFRVFKQAGKKKTTSEAKSAECLLVLSTSWLLNNKDNFVSLHRDFLVQDPLCHVNMDH